MVSSYVNTWPLLTFSKACFRRRRQAQVLNIKLGMSPSSTVYGGQYDENYMAFEWLSLHVALVADTIWGFSLNQPVLVRQNAFVVVTP